MLRSRKTNSWVAKLMTRHLRLAAAPNIMGDSRLCRGGSRSLTYPRYARRLFAVVKNANPLEARSLIMRKGKFLANSEAIPTA